MNFELDADQQQLQASLRRLLDSEASFERRRAAAASATGFNAALWRSLAELGVVAIALPEAHGGYGMPPIALLPVLRELGRALALEPFLATAVLGATAVVHAGSPAQQDALLSGVASAACLLAFAHDEAAARHAPLWVETRARLADGQWFIDGNKDLVLHGMSADTLIVSARSAGAPNDTQGVSLFLVQAAQPGVRRAAVTLIDDTPAAEIEFSAAVAEPLGSAPGTLPDAPPNLPLGTALDTVLGTRLSTPLSTPSSTPPRGWQAILAVQQAGIAAVCAEALGVAERAYAMTVDYVQTRQQFGRAIGANQAVRHRVAEMAVALEAVRSAAMAGLLALELSDAAGRARELSRAKMLVSRHAIFIAQQAVQLHGGMGMTLELAVGHCLRRLTVLDQLFGDGATHAARLGAELAGAEGPTDGPTEGRTAGGANTTAPGGAPALPHDARAAMEA